MPTPPDFTSGQILTADQMSAIGMWEIGSGTLSLTTSATNVTGVFSSTYKQYRVLLNTTAKSTTNRVDMKYIVGTTPTSTNYYMAGIGSDYSANTVLYYQRSNADTQLFGLSSNSDQTMVLDIFNANKAATTLHQGNVADKQSGYSYAIGGMQNSGTQFTGFQLFTSAGTATVEYQVFGYRD
jgi:hypothetical protein